LGFKRIVRRVAKFILASQPDAFVKVKVAQINYGEIHKDRKIVITGGGRGLGFYMAKKFLAEGSKVLIAGRNESTLKNAVRELGKNCFYITYDATEYEKSKGFIQKANDILGGIDCLICNAGISLHEGNFQNVTLEGWDKQFNTNLKGTYFLAKEFLELKMANKDFGGNLMFISSETGNQCYDTPYGLTKAAINSLTGALSRRVYHTGIRVNAIAPGVTLSDMTKDYAEAADGNMYRDCASGRIFLPEEVAELACFLASDAAKCISGEIIHCNGGNHLKTFWEKN